MNQPLGGHHNTTSNSTLGSASPSSPSPRGGAGGVSINNNGQQQQHFGWFSSIHQQTPPILHIYYFVFFLSNLFIRFVIFKGTRVNGSANAPDRGSSYSEASSISSADGGIAPTHGFYIYLLFFNSILI